MSALFRPQLKPQELGIDLGTTTLRVCVGGNVVLREPAVVALAKETGEVQAVGEDAYHLLGRDPGHTVVVRPLQDGIIADYPLTEALLHALLRRVKGGPSRLLGQKLLLCVPGGVTDADKTRVLQTVRGTGAKRAQLIEAPLAAALGAGLPVTEPTGSLVVDVGGGTTDIAVISLGGVVVSESLRLAGNEFDEAIVRSLRHEQNVLIGERSAEEIKRRIGTVHLGPTQGGSADQADRFTVRGRDLASSVVKEVTVTADEVSRALRDPLEKLAAGVQRVLETAPPELVADVIDAGLVLTGGGASTRNLAELLRQTTGVHARIAENAPDCTVLGIGKAFALSEQLAFAPEQTG